MTLFYVTFNLITLNQIEWPWEERPPEEWYEGPSLVLWVLGWIFLVIGLISLTILILYTKYGREISIRLSIITILVASIFLGFGFHFILLNFGY
ncbi:MAG: OST5 family protein [Candidatus Hodarchaeota archaeon]